MPSATQRSRHTHRNHYLFADYYLDNRLVEHAEWQTADPAAALATLTGLWDQFTPQANNEAQTEYEWIRPVLEALGHTFNVQVSLQTPFGTKRPDYVLYPDEASQQVAKAAGGALTGTDLQTALAVADAKAWARNLDRSGGDKGPARKLALTDNPSLQMYLYIQYSGLPWGVLTNGQQWRLYQRDTAEKLDVFYEVDLPALIEQGDPEAFKYFYLFFRRAAFQDTPGKAAWLNRVLAQSRAYARGVSDHLREQVYEALGHLAQGFLDFPPNRLDPTPDTLKTIYDHSLIVLYRLLFILYAESRGLLPVPDNQLYTHSYSLDAIKKRLARELDTAKPAAPSMAGYWDQLRNLWAAIDAGNPDLDVPAYNGGLFKQPPDSFLARYRVGDLHLRRAIDLLARIRDPETRQRVFVDYRDLEIRHLGSIYEGLLEYQVRVAEQPLWVKTEKGREIYTAETETRAPSVEPGQVYLTTDKGERKATGSYYTPDYIVKYIVEQTVRPVLDGLRNRYNEGDGNLSDAAGLAQAILNVNVLDPSMGSGHFLVEATDFIARYLVALDLPRSGEGEEESDLAYWRRRVVQACIYGVDVNPLAVELAKLSLWLTTVAKGKPLSFLDHHLRCGNSLIGARVADLPLEATTPPANRRRTKRQQQAEAKARAAGQLSMLDDSAFAGSMRTATGFMSQIETLRGDTLDDIHQAEQLYRQVVEEVTKKARDLADVWTARAFGLELDETLWAGLARHLLHGGFELPQYNRILEQARVLAKEHRFFHWELEFPEVFFDAYGALIPAGGFEAVVGNPPYVRQEQTSALKPYFAQAYSPVYHGVADIYVYFYHQGLELLQAGGRMSYIVNNKWLRAGYGEPLRGYFAEMAEVEQIVDFGHAPIFAEADTFPCIIVLRRPDNRDKQNKDIKTDICLFPREVLGQVELTTYVQQHSYKVPMTRFDANPWSLERADVDELMDKIRQAGTPLKDVMGFSPSYGIKTGFNKAFLIDTPTREKLIHKDPNCTEIIRPYLRGQDIKRWLADWVDLWIILLKSSGDYAWPWSEAGDEAEKIFAQTYPSLYEHFKPNENRLRKRYDRGVNWWELRSCAYYHYFDKPKLAYQEIQFHPSYSYDDKGYLTNNKVFILPDANLYLLAVLNSPLMWWHNWRYLPHMKDEALTPKGEAMEELPIAPPTDEILAEVEPAVERLITLTQEERQLTKEVLHWLQVEFGIDKLGQKLSSFDTLDQDTFIKEVKRRRPRSAKRLSPGDLSALRETYQDHTPHIHTLQAEAQQLEQRLATLVNTAYGLTPDEVDLLWRTAPPRMPVGRSR